MNTTVLAERYRLDTHLARGGMADVYAATDELLGRRVAVKMLHANYATDTAFIQRFRREAQAAANLTHPNIVSIYDTGQDRASHFIVMELVEGTTLRDVLKQGGSLLPRRAAEIAAEVAAALAVAARGGLVHRDIKPGNILLTTDGSVKVADFGIARAWDDSEELTRTGAVIGTATYFSPEQAQGHAADGRSDIYALGVLLYEMLCGRPPFSGETPVAIAYQHVSEVPMMPSSSNPDVPPELDAIVMRAMEKRPDLRYQTAEAMRQDLLRFLRGLPVAATDPEAATRLIAAPPTAPPDEVYRQVADLPPERRTPWGVLFGSLALLAVVAVAIVLVSQGLRADDPEDLLVPMPSLVGLSEERALEDIQDLGLRFSLGQTASDEVNVGDVAATEPEAGVLVAPDQRVRIIVSTGAETFPVPTVVGRDIADARQALAEAQFVVQEEYITNDDVAAGQVISQDPAPGTNHPPNTIIRLVISSGPEQVVLSEYSGFADVDAVTALSNLGVQVLIEKEFHPTIPDGLVIRTDPPALSIITAEIPVTLVVSQGPEPVEVPNLVGQPEGEAVAALQGLGLTVAFGPGIEVSEESGQAGTVVAQQPAFVESLLVEPGTTITLQIGQLPPPTTTTTAPSDDS